MQRHSFTSEFFQLFPRAGSVELPAASSLHERGGQMERRLEFISEKMPHAQFCTIFKREGPVGTVTTAEFHFSTPADAAFFKLGAHDL